MERPTKNVTVGSHAIVMYDYITGREAQQIAAIAGRKEDGKSDLDQQITANNSAFKIVITKFDDIEDPDKILEAVLNLPIVEFTELSALVTGLIDPKKK
jgi:hypothetical protein